MTLFRDQEQFPKATFMMSWHRSLGAPDAGQAAPPIRAWTRWSRFKNNSHEPGMREANFYAPTANALAAFLATVS